MDDSSQEPLHPPFSKTPSLRSESLIVNTWETKFFTCPCSSAKILGYRSSILSLEISEFSLIISEILLQKENENQWA